MKVSGGCHCGRVRYEAVVDAGTIGLCHCTDCQTLTGAPYRATIMTAADDFKLLSGELKTYIKTADSGAMRAHAFCPNCGTPIHASAVTSPTTYSLRVGNIKQNKEFMKPMRQNWCASALPWAMDIRDVPAKAQQ